MGNKSNSFGCRFVEREREEGGGLRGGEEEGSLKATLQMSRNPNDLDNQIASGSTAKC